MIVPEVGDRIELLRMPDDPAPIEPGTTGTVRKVTAMPWHQSNGHQITVDWDVDRSLALCIPPDVVRVIVSRNEKPENDSDE